MSYTPPYKITSQISHLLTDIGERLGALQAIDSKLNAPRLRRQNQVKTITGTLQIEGNSFSEEKVTAVLEGKRVLGTPKELAEVQGAIAVYEQLPHYDAKNMDHLLDAHALMMGKILIQAGTFRRKPVGVYGKDGVSHIAPPVHRVSGLMADLFNWLQTTDEHPLISSCVFHYEFEFIHPFIDGNGRLGRLWQTVILSKWKPLFQAVPIESIIRDHQQDYYKALQQAGNEGESTAFILFMLQVVLEAINKVSADSDQVGDQASDQVERLLSIVSSHWLSSAEMMTALDLSHKPTFRKNYLNPALEQGFIIMKHPDSPRSPKQQYKRASQ